MLYLILYALIACSAGVVQPLHSLLLVVHQQAVDNFANTHLLFFFSVPITLQTTNLPRIGFTFFLLVLYNTLGVQLLVYISSHERKKQRLLYYHHNCFSHNYTCLQKEWQRPKVQANCPFPFVHVTNRSILLSHSSRKKRVSSNVLLFYRQSFLVSVIGLS